jgi:hypothetical protein
MEEHYKPPHILRLPDISLSDYQSVEDAADDRLLSSTMNTASLNISDLSINPPDKIPRIFNGIDTWSHRTNLRCWQCDFDFDDQPKFVPTFVRESENGGIEFGVLGNFCTFNCAESWININFAGNEDQRWRAQDNLCLVYFIFTGRRVHRILPAPLKTELRIYGGDLDADTFRKKLRDLDILTGICDHALGGILPERERPPIIPENIRIKLAVTSLKAKGAPISRETSSNSVWKICTNSLSNDDIDDILNDL